MRRNVSLHDANYVKKEFSCVWERLVIDDVFKLRIMFEESWGGGTDEYSSIFCGIYCLLYTCKVRRRAPIAIENKVIKIINICSGNRNKKENISDAKKESIIDARAIMTKPEAETLPLLDAGKK